MQHLSADQRAGRQILGIFIQRAVPAGGALMRNNFFDVRDSDFQRGIDAAVANDWIKVDPRNRYRYLLTAAGFAAGQRPDTPAET